MKLAIHYRQAPPLFCAAIAAALVLMVMTLWWWFSVEKVDAAWQHTYAQSLAAMAARSAVDATLNHDLVSLQVALQDLVQSAAVTTSTIHDVENNLLVQAGERLSPHLLDEAVSYSAAISFQNTVAGYLTLYLAPVTSLKAVFYSLFGLAGLFLLVALLSLAEAWDRVFESIAPTPPIPTATPGSIHEDAIGSAINSAIDSEQSDEPYGALAGPVVATAEVHCQIVDLPRLQQQLSASLFDRVYRCCQERLNDSLALYGGRWLEPVEEGLQHGTLAAAFDSYTSGADAVKTATFFAELAKLSLLAATKVPLSIAVTEISLEDVNAPLPPERPGPGTWLWLSESMVHSVSEHFSLLTDSGALCTTAGAEAAVNTKAAIEITAQENALSAGLSSGGPASEIGASGAELQQNTDTSMRWWQLLRLDAEYQTLIDQQVVNIAV